MEMKFANYDVIKYTAMVRESLDCDSRLTKENILVDLIYRNNIRGKSRQSALDRAMLGQEREIEDQADIEPCRILPSFDALPKSIAKLNL